MRIPKKFIANLGDVNITEGAFLIYWVPESLEYEAQVVEPVSIKGESGYKEMFRVYRFPLERQKWVRGLTGKYLVNHAYDPDTHPLPLQEYQSWLVQHLPGVAATCGVELPTLCSLLCSEDPRELGRAYQMLGECLGWREFDFYPLELSRGELNRRYRLLKGKT